MLTSLSLERIRTQTKRSFCGVKHLFLALTGYYQSDLSLRWTPLLFCLGFNCSTPLLRAHISLWSAVSHEMGPEKQSVLGPPVQLRRLQRCCERGIRCCVETWGAWVHTDRHFGNWAKVLSKVCLECVTERHFHNQIERGFALTAFLQLISAVWPPGLVLKCQGWSSSHIYTISTII